MRFSDFILLLNTLWFGAAFIQFSVAQGNTLKILVPREEHGNPIAPTLSASVAFLGGQRYEPRQHGRRLHDGKQVFLVMMGAAQHHRQVYGNRPYELFAAEWEAGLEDWDPDAWAARFAATGARYVVFVTKHMDGYCLWPTGVRNSHRPGWNSRRDVVGELAEAVRGAGMRFGIYYSGGLDATGWSAGIRAALAERVHASLEYSLARTNWNPADGADYLLVVAPSALRRSMTSPQNCA